MMMEKPLLRPEEHRDPSFFNFLLLAEVACTIYEEEKFKEKDGLMTRSEKSRAGSDDFSKGSYPWPMSPKRKRLMREKFLKKLPAGAVIDTTSHIVNQTKKRRLCEGDASSNQTEGLATENKRRKIMTASLAAADATTVPDGDPLRVGDLHQAPENLKNYIEGNGGAALKLVIQKHLTGTDVNRHHDRLSMPLSQLISSEFLTPDEKTVLSSRTASNKLNSLAVTLIQLSTMEHCTVKLRKWDMTKKSGKTSSSYVLSSAWNSVVKSNRLRENDLVQLWAFRCDSNSILCFALLKVNADGAHTGRGA